MHKDFRNSLSLELSYIMPKSGSACIKKTEARRQRMGNSQTLDRDLNQSGTIYLENTPRNFLGRYQLGER